MYLDTGKHIHTSRKILYASDSSSVQPIGIRQKMLIKSTDAMRT